MDAALEGRPSPVVVRVGRCGDDDEVDKPRIEHLSGVAESLRSGCELLRGSDPLGVDVAHCGEFPTGDAADRLAVLVSDSAVCQESNSHTQRLAKMEKPAA